MNQNKPQGIKVNDVGFGILNGSLPVILSFSLKNRFVLGK